MRKFLFLMVLVIGCTEKERSGYCSCENFYGLSDSLNINYDRNAYKYGYLINQFENSAFYENFIDYLLRNKEKAYWIDFSDKMIIKCDSLVNLDENKIYYVKIKGVIDTEHKGHLNQYRKGEIILNCISVIGEW